MQPSTAERRVLVVDDEKVIADSLMMIVRSRGFDGRAAYSAEEAIRIAESFRPQAVISDVMMPGMDGVELAVYLRANYPECTILLISGNATAAEVLEGRIPSGQSPPRILLKPIHPAEILNFLASMFPTM